MRVLLTTAPWKGIVPFFTCRKEHHIKLKDINDKDDLLQLCMNTEYQLGFEWPNSGLWLIKENVPSIDILDYPSMEEYEACLNDTQYDVVAFSFRRRNVPRIVEMVKLARDYGVKETWAGNYGANSPGMEEYMDRIFIGDGIRPMKSIIENKPLEYLRHPILTGKIYFRYPVGYLITAIGCRYKCKFCSTRHFIPEPLYTPIDEIRRVLDVYVRKGIQTVTILDETFLQDEAGSDMVITELQKREILWHCTTRINLLKGRIRQLHDRGMRSIYTGIESLTNHTLKSYSKGHTTEEILDVFKELNDLNIQTTVSYILGYEFDTIESVLESIDIIKHDIRPFCNPYLVMTPHVNSRITHLEPLVIDRDPEHYDTRHLVWMHPHLSPEDIRELLWVAHRETVHPRNFINKRIVAKLEKIESDKAPLYSDKVHEIHCMKQEHVS
jgi:MoaA/NifB/PqqE/SkfB family radical SAM enzyme